MATRVLERPPRLAPLYARAARGALPDPLRGGRRSDTDGSGDLPDLRLLWRGVRVDPGALAGYRRVCGFAPGGSVPATYLHVPAFRLHLALMTDAAFPFPVLGLVHIGNRIEQRRPLDVGERFDLTVYASDLRPHPKGQQFTITSEASVGADPVWHEQSTLLRRAGSTGVAPDGDDAQVPERAPFGPVTWRLPGSLGRAYGKVSGDRNPIHLSRATARAFGFKRQIVHGMWTKARTLAEVANRLPDSFAVTVEFRRPILLPGTVRFGAREETGRLDFGVTTDDARSVHLLGRILG